MAMNDSDVFVHKQGNYVEASTGKGYSISKNAGEAIVFSTHYCAVCYFISGGITVITRHFAIKITRFFSSYSYANDGNVVPFGYGFVGILDCDFSLNTFVTVGFRRIGFVVALDEDVIMACVVLDDSPMLFDKRRS